MEGVADYTVMASIDIDYETLPERIPLDVYNICEEHNLTFRYGLRDGSIHVEVQSDSLTDYTDLFERCKAVMLHYGWNGSVRFGNAVYFVADDWRERVERAYANGLRQLREQYPQWREDTP